MAIQATNYDATKEYDVAEMSDLYNDNLLTNSDFKSGIINQKGQDTYRLNNDTPTLTVDGWIGIGTFVVVEREQGYLNIYENRGTGDSYFLQKLYNPINGDYTFYINLSYMSSGTLEVYIEGTDQSDKLTISAEGEYAHTFKNVSNGKGVTLHLKGFNGDIYSMKLEKGSHYTGMPLWNEALELLKCKRSYRIVKAKSKGDVIAIVPTDNEGLFQIPMDISGMRKRPSVNIKDIWTNSGGVYAQASTHSVYDDSILFKCDTKNAIVQVYFDSTDAYIVADSYDY